MNWYPYAIAAALVVLSLLLGRARGGNRFRARDISTSNIHVGNVGGKPEPDRVAWAIGIVGALIAAAALVHDIWGGK